MSGESGFGCPLPDDGPPGEITLAHGEGGRLTRELIDHSIVPALGSEPLQRLGDAAELPQIVGPVAMTTDSYVVSPLFFPGGDIGSLAVYGTANDLAVAGAKPLWISLALIVEEGLPLSIFQRVLTSIATAAKGIGLQVATGDTKVVPRGAADKLFINTTGLGEIIPPAPPGPESITEGDAILVSGPIARHGMAVMTSRASLALENPPHSDSAPLVEATTALREAGIPVRAMRDATRGGVAAVLHEWSGCCDLTFVIEETQLPVDNHVRGACELLGLDPLHVANEGTMLIALPADAADAALRVLQNIDQTTGAQIIGHASSRTLSPVLIRRPLGGDQPLDLPLGAPLPRIC